MKTLLPGKNTTPKISKQKAKQHALDNYIMRIKKNTTKQNV